MRVLFTSHLFYDEPGYSGGSWINALLDLWKDIKGIEVGIIYPSYSRDEPYRAKGISYFPIKISFLFFLALYHFLRIITISKRRISHEYTKLCKLKKARN